MAKKRKYSSFILNIWLLFQVVLAAAIIFSILALGNNAPALDILHNSQEINGLSPKTIDTINSMGLLLNSLIVVFCVYIFIELRQRKEMSKNTLTALLAFIPIGFIADIPLGNVNFIFNVISSGMLLMGLYIARPQR